MAIDPDQLAALEQQAVDAVAAQIRAEIARLDTTPLEVGRRVGLSSHIVGRMQRGKHPLDVRKLARVAESLGLDLVVELRPRFSDRLVSDPR